MKSLTLSFSSLLVVCTCLTSMSAQTIPRLYIANDDHTDYIWTGTESQYQDWFIEMLDYYVDQAERTKNEQPDLQGRFNADGNFWLWIYEKHKTTEEFAKLIEKIRSGHITIPLQTLVLLYGGMPAEAILRSMYYAGRIERKYHLKFELACAMENQTLPLGLVSLWAGSGAKYSWRGVCGCASKLNMYVDRPREIYYAQGTDGQTVLMKWNSLFNNESVGGYAEARHPQTAVNIMTSNQDYLSRWKWSARGLFGKGWDDQKTLTDEFITTARSTTNASRRVIVSNQLDFFKDFEATAPNETPIPTYSGSFGNEWDLYIASMAEVSASVKRSVEELRTAEALATLVSLRDPDFTTSMRAVADSAFVNMGLYYEHDWTMDGAASSERPAFQRRVAQQIQRYVSDFKLQVLQRLSAYIPNPQGTQRFFVFNPLGWKRTDIADIEMNPLQPLRVIDLSTNEEVRSQIVVKNKKNYLRILASDIPSVGYKVFEIRNGQTQFLDSAVTRRGFEVMESDRYRVVFSGSRIASIVDKHQANREIVATQGSNQYLNQLTGVNQSGQASIGMMGGTVSGMYEYKFANFGFPHTVRVSMHKGIDRIDIENVMDYSSGELVTRDFAFDLADFTVRHEEVGAIATAKRVSKGGSYSDELARTDWLTMNHFVDLSTNDFGVTISNSDSPFFKLGNSTVDSLDTSTPVLRAVVAARFDNLGARNQDGEKQFLNRYAIRTHGSYDQAAAMRFALEHQNPLCASIITGTQPFFPSTSYSLLDVADSNCILWALKPSEEGFEKGGVIARVWNLANSPSSLTLKTYDQKITAAFRASHIETNIDAASFDNFSLKDRLEKQMMRTYRLNLTASATIVRDAKSPASFTLEQNFPNPFDTKTVIRISRSTESRSSSPIPSLRIVDLFGRTVLDLTNAIRDNHEVMVDCSQLSGAGMYFCVLTSQDGIQSKVMIAR